MKGGEYAMIDIITTGWAAVSSVREICQDLGLAMHAHGNARSNDKGTRTRAFH